MNTKPLIINHPTDSTPAVVAIPGQPVRIFGHVDFITDYEQGVQYLRDQGIDPPECRHCGYEIEPDPKNEWRHSTGTVGCGLTAGGHPTHETYAEPAR